MKRVAILMLTMFLIFGCTSGMPVRNTYKVIGTNATCTVGFNEFSQGNCGFSFFIPCSDGIMYKCVGVGKVN